MTILSGTLFVVGAILALAVICWGILWFERRAPTEDFDERQKQARGSAYRISFWMGIIYSLVVISLAAFDGDARDLHFLVMVGILCQIMVFHICCLLKHAALPLSRQPKGMIAFCMLFGVKNIVELYLRNVDVHTPLYGISNSAWIDLISAVCFILLAAMHMIQLWREKKESAE